MKPKKTRTFVSALCLLTAAVSNGQCPASFTAQNSSGSIVQFSAAPLPPNGNASYTWHFGDNSQPATGIGTNTMSHTYPGNGVYNVTLAYSDSVSSPPCFSGTVTTVTVTNSTCNDSINFTWTPAANGICMFYGGSFNNSTYSYHWDFGDGSQTNGLSPVHTYTGSGVYTVVLTASTSPAICTYTVAKVVTVTIVPCPIAASFTYATSGNQATLVSTSTGTTATSFYGWQLGDGNTAYGNPVVHTYSNNGTYNVQLILNDSSSVFCDDTIQQPVSITNGTCLINLSFTAHKDSSQPLTWYIYPTVGGNISSVLWNWGDGSTSNSLYTTHTFSAAGMYNICLSATTACGSTSTTCLQSNIYRTAAGEMISVFVKDQVTGVIQEKPASQPLKVIPNPSSGEFTIQLPTKSAVRKVAIFDLLGKQVWESDRGYDPGHRVQVSVSGLPAGSYLLTLTGENETLRTRIVLTE